MHEHALAQGLYFAAGRLAGSARRPARAFFLCFSAHMVGAGRLQYALPRAGLLPHPEVQHCSTDSLLSDITPGGTVAHLNATLASPLLAHSARTDPPFFGGRTNCCVMRPLRPGVLLALRGGQPRLCRPTSFHGALECLPVQMLREILMLALSIRTQVESAAAIDC